MSYTYKIFNQGPSSTHNFTFELFIPNTIYNNKEIIKIKSVEYVYKNFYSDLKSDLTNHTKMNEIFSNSTKTESKMTRVLLLNCDSEYVGCLSAQGSIINFVSSEDDHIEVIIKFTIRGKLLGKIIF